MSNARRRVFSTAQITLIDVAATGLALYGAEVFREMRRATGWPEAEIEAPDWRFEVFVPAEGGGDGDGSTTTMNSGATAADLAAVLEREADRLEGGEQ